MTVLYEFLPLLLMFVVGVGFWAVGQWLRRRGHGEQLDRLGVRFVIVRHHTYRFLGPLFGNAAVGLGRGLSGVPLLGSKRSREQLNVIDSTPKQKQDK